MSQKSPPFGFFWYFATKSLLMNPKGSPLFFFWHYATFSKFFSKKNFKKISKKFSKFFCFQSGKVIFQSYRAWKAHFGCLESVFKAFHEYILGIFRKLCAFWALDIAPTLDVPVLFHLQTNPWNKCRFSRRYFDAVVKMDEYTASYYNNKSNKLQ